jgi:hypothetical protein
VAEAALVAVSAVEALAAVVPVEAGNFSWQFTVCCVFNRKTYKNKDCLKDFSSVKLNLFQLVT